MTTLSPKQRLSFKESNAKINIWQGAVRSGKTYVSLWRFLKELTYGPPGEYALICRTYDAYKRNVLPQLMRMIGSDVRYYAGKRETVIWGKTVHIIGADDESAEAKIRGPTFMGAYVDEATILPESVFKMLISRCAMGGAKIFVTTNPDSPFHWLYTGYLQNNPDVASWSFTLEDNPELTDAEKAYLCRQYQGLWYLRFIEGKWVQAEGAVYDFFDQSLHVIDNVPPTAEYYICGLDYGTANPCAFILIGVNMNKYPNMWIEQEYYYDSRARQRQKTDSEYAHDLRKFLWGKNVKAVYIDPSAASFKQELLRQGVGLVLDAENEVIDGVRFVAKLMNNGSLKVSRGCANIIREFQAYVWDPKAQKRGLDKPMKENDHALDALRYAIFTHFSKRAPGTVDWDKEYADAMGGGGPVLPRFFLDPVDPMSSSFLN